MPGPVAQVLAEVTEPSRQASVGREQGCSGRELSLKKLNRIVTAPLREHGDGLGDGFTGMWKQL